MKQFMQTLPYLIVGFVLGLLGLLLGRYVFPHTDSTTEAVNSRSIVQSVSSQGFLVTQTIIAEHKVTYKVDKGSDWSNFWWGHQITARAVTSTSFGIDLSKLDESMVRLNNTNKTVCFVYPTPTIQSTTLSGEIEVQTASGLLKRIFASDTNNDYNLALNLLKNEAEKSVKSVPSIDTDAYKQADKTIGFLFNKTAYSVTSDCHR